MVHTKIIDTLQVTLSDDIDMLKGLHPAYSVWEWEGEDPSPLQYRFAGIALASDRFSLPGDEWWEVDY